MSRVRAPGTSVCSRYSFGACPTLWCKDGKKNRGGRLSKSLLGALQLLTCPTEQGLPPRHPAQIPGTPQCPKPSTEPQVTRTVVCHHFPGSCANGRKETRGGEAAGFIPHPYVPEAYEETQGACRADFSPGNSCTCRQWFPSSPHLLCTFCQGGASWATHSAFSTYHRFHLHFLIIITLLS